MSDFYQQIADLSPKQRMLFEKRLKQKGLSNLKTLETSQIEISKRKGHKELPLSFAQHRLWFFQQLNPDNSAYNGFSALRLEGQLNVGLLKKVFTEIVRRHESLRTTFITNSEGQPIQVIGSAQSITLPIIDLKEAPNKEQEAQRLALAEAQRPFDLTKPLLRIALLQLQKTEYVLLLTIHHIISDRWSVGVFVREMTVLYKAFSSEQPSPLPELPIQYADWAIWQQQYLQGEVLEAQMSYWKQQLSNVPILYLPTDRPRSAVATYKGAKQSLELSKTLSNALKALSVQEGVTLFTLLLAAFKVLLHKYTNQNDIVVGTDIANRNRVETEGLIGFLINTLVLRTNLSGNLIFRELLRRIREVTLGAYDHQDLPFDKLVDVLNPERNLNQMVPLFQVKFDLQLAKVEQLELSDLSVSPLIFDNGTAKFELRFNLSETEQGIKGLVEYSTDLFDTTTITRMVEHFQTLLESIVTNPEYSLSQLPLLTETELHKLLVEWNDTSVEYPQHQCIHQLFEAQVERTPDAVAVAFESEQLTYCELNARANQLAHYLQKLGVGPEVLVGICTERSLCTIIGLLGILKAGGAYVPLDPAYPQERLAFMLSDSQVPLLLTQQQLGEKLPEHQAQVVCLDTDWNIITQQSQDNPVSISKADNLAYVIYTSGSTGQPKGILGLHRGAVNRFHWMWQSYPFMQAEICCQKTSLNFVDSVWEIFGPLLQGVPTVIVPDNILKDPQQLVKTLASNNVTRLVLVPSLLSVLLDTYTNLQLRLPLLNLWISSGEVLSINILQQFREILPQSTLLNLYGSSEVSADVTHHRISPQASMPEHVSIGRPIANTQIYILDATGQPAPIGIPGELHIGGDGLARGYLNRLELTAEKFIPNPFENSKVSRLYKTGDLARYLPNGEIEYIGRIDHQIKVRGFRIELGEIEALLCQHPAVRETVVIIRSDSADSQRIVAYVVPQTEQTLTITELRDFLESKLPNYMVPAAFVILEALPLTPNGKVDRKVLPVPDATQLVSDFTPPSTPIEQMLGGIWAEVLGLEKVGIHHNFFELGGHSLLATRVISQVRQVFQQELPLRRLFEQPTIAGLAKEIEKATKVGLGLETANIERISRSQKLPLSFAQQRLWFLAQLEQNSPFYNIRAAVRLQGQLNQEALQQSFNEILRRHETLRTNFQTTQGEPVAIISSVTPLLLSVVDISELSSNQQQAQVRHLADFEAQQPFDLKSDLMLRVKLLCLGEQEHIVLLTLHHIASDGWSIGVLVRELATLYQAFCTEQPSLRHATLTQLAELPIQYADFAAWQRQWLQAEVLQSQISYWKKQLEGAPSVLELPTDHARPTVQTFRGASYSFELSQELSQALNKLSQQQGCTLFMTLLAAFQTLLWRYTGQEDIVVGSPIANRNRAEIEGLIGFFVNTLVLRTNLAGHLTFKQLLTRVREMALGAYAHQDLPFEKLVEELQPQRSLSHTPLFQVMFVLQNAPMSALELPGLTLSSLESESGNAKFDLTLSIRETAQRLVGSLEYNTDLFKKSTISRMAEHLQTLLSGIVANPQQRLSELPLLTEAEKALLVKWNDTQAEYPKDQCIHQLFEAQVERTPDAVAMVFEDQQLTYKELNERANQLAHYLRSLGVGAEVLVGICVERSLDMIVGLLGILKAGGAYVPLDPTYPQERLSFILKDAQVAVLLTQARLVEAMPQHQARVVCLDTDWLLIAQENKENSLTEVTTSNNAYVIYTSGSTGQPKGTLIIHQGLVNYLSWCTKAYAVADGSGAPVHSSIGFDATITSLFSPLLVGKKVVLLAQKQEIEALAAILCSQSQFSLVKITPAHLDLLSFLIPNWSANNQTRAFIIGGEALSGKSVSFWREAAPSTKLINEYGPTETVVGCCVYEVDAQTQLSDGIPIGRAIANTQLYILDRYLQPVPIGVLGELYIGGAGVARGYLNRPELTAEKFIPNPFSNKLATRLYKTGDLARYLPNGEIKYIGRIDDQVKVRGFRIELAEIEAHLSQYPAVQETIVVVRSDSADSQRIVAYVVPQTQQRLTITELRNFLESKLPNYMVPAAFVMLEALPLTPNGKVDRKALPAPDTARPELEAVYQPPQTEIEKVIANIWEEVLHVEDVGIYDNFFELGGHSLLLVQVHSKLQKKFQRDFPLVEMFQYPTINRLAIYLGQESSEQQSFTQHSHRSETITASVQRRKQARIEHRAAQKGVSFQ
ncbi:MAG: amino acid adenylation domain-containing protein [Nostoc sp.]|uniref:amino acid adenylation domain-containing protein n=1 Tax=Nostoc sp. TaxID=1180 RepID=UPI002FF901C2